METSRPCSIADRTVRAMKFVSRTVLGALLLSGLFLAPSGFAQNAGPAEGSNGSDEKPAIKVGPKTLSKQAFQKRVDRQMKRMKRRMKGKKNAAKKLDRMRKMVRNQIQKRSVGDMLLTLHAEKSGTSVSSDEVDSKWKEFVDRFGSEKKFKQRLEKAGYDPAGFREKLKEQLLVEKFVNDRTDTNVTDEDVRTFYEENKRKFKGNGFEKMKDRIRKRLEQRRQQQATKELVDKLREKTDVTVNISS